MKYVDSFIQGYTGYANWLWGEITHPSWNNYFYLLILISAIFFFLEVLVPWRKKQKVFRKDFWLDCFYMFFNFFIFGLIIYNAASNVFVDLFKDFLGLFGVSNLLALEVQSWPIWAHLLVGFVLRDFVQWWIHRLLHKSDRLWEFHKVHHSVEEMGFAAHLRYHWMENVVYRSLEYIPLAMIGIGLNDFFMIHIFTLAVGHYNHSNLRVSGRTSAFVLGTLVGFFAISQIGSTALIELGSEFSSGLGGAMSSSVGYAGIVIALMLLAGMVCSLILGPFMKYIFNSPEMHIWHHSYELPRERRDGINFALTLACWDYIFGTAYIPHDGRDIRLGFPGVESFPDGFIAQNTHGFSSSKKS